MRKYEVDVTLLVYAENEDDAWQEAYDTMVMADPTDLRKDYLGFELLEDSIRIHPT